MSIKEKGIKTSHLKELSKMSVKLPTDEPCFYIQLHVICSAEGNGKVSPTNEISYVDRWDDCTYHKSDFKHDTERDIS
jgi:hypothetical protein